MTLLVSSHILAELDAYCTDMLVLRQGKIVEQVTVKNQTRHQTFQLILAWPQQNLEVLLKQLSDVSILKITDNRQALLQLSAEPPQQHAVLKAILALDLPVCEFAPIANNLQDAYLQTIRQKS
jgi:ABC-2 type transport system ATP-binding protein